MLTPYPAYKDSGAPWLGRVPEHWEIRKIKYAFDERVQKGFSDEPLLAATQTKGVVPKAHYENRTVVALKDLHLLKLVKKGDFVISLRSFQGGIELAHFQGIISPAYTIMIPRSVVDTGYFKHLAKSSVFIELLKTCVTGIREGQNIDYEILKRHNIPLPDIDEQIQIARFLDFKTDQIARFIRSKQRMIALLNEQKQAIINQAVTGQINVCAFSDVSGSCVKDCNANDATGATDASVGKRYPAYKPSGVAWLGEIPAHWEIVAIKHIAESIQTGPFGSQLHAHDYIENGIPTINPKHIKDGKIVPDYKCSVDQATFERLSQYQLTIGDLILARRGEIGRCALIGKNENGWLCGTGSMRLRPRKGFYIGEYLVQIISCKQIAPFLSLESVGATMDNLNASIVGRLHLPIPPITEQIKIIQSIQKIGMNIDTIISRCEREIALMQEYCARLIADVVTGQTDVRGVAVPDEATEEEIVEEESMTEEDTEQR